MADERLTFDLVARDRASRDFDKVGDAAVRAGRDFDKASDGAGHLQMQIDDTTRTLRRLGDEFDRTGDRALLKDIGKERRTLSGLTKLRKEMVGLADATGDVGKTATKSLTDALGALPAQIKGTAIVGLVGVAAAAAPAIGAIVGGAILAGIGAAGIGTGVALAFQDPRVDGAASDLGMRVKTAFVDASAGMVQPTIDALGVLGDAGADVAREMGSMWDELAPEVVPLAEAIGDMARNIMPGLRDAVEVAKPALRILARELPEIGDAFSDMFSTISEEGDGALLGLVALLDGLEGAIRFTGDAIAFLSAAFEDSVRAGSEFAGNMEDVLGWVPVIGDKFRETNDRGERWLKILEESKHPADTANRASRDVRDAVADAGEAAEKAAHRFDDLFGQWMSLDQAAIAVEAAFDDLTEAISDNGRTLDINTEAGRDNRSALLDAVAAAEKHRQKMIESGTSVSYANQVFQDTVNKLYAQAAAAGFDRAKLDELLAKYRDLANAPNIVKTITYKQVFTSQGQAFQPAGGGHAFFSHGGPVEGPGPKGVDSVRAILAPGEFVLRAAAVDRIGLQTLQALNQGRVAAAAPTSSGPSGSGGGGSVTLDFSGMSGGDQLLAKWLHSNISAGRIQLKVSSGRVVVG